VEIKQAAVDEARLGPLGSVAGVRYMYVCEQGVKTRSILSLGSLVMKASLGEWCRTIAEQIPERVGGMGQRRANERFAGRCRLICG
jgi:hypothetical protein